MNNNPVRYNDPSGHCLILCTAIIGAAIGAVVGAVGYTISTVATGTEFNTGTMLVTAGAGAIAGAVIGSGVGIVAAAASTVTAAVEVGTATTVASTVATTVGADGDYTNEGTAVAQALGQAGETAAEIIKNTQRIPSITGTANFRIPDQLLPDMNLLSEVKNVAYQAYTSQIKDFLLYAQGKGYEFELTVRENTAFSKPLQALIDAGQIIVNNKLPVPE